MKSYFSKIALALFSFAIVFQAQAIEYRFKSKILSSGPNIWACNAGVASAIKKDKICYFEGKPEKGLCTDQGCGDKKVCNTDCVCTSKAGMQWINLINFSTAKVDAYGTPTTPFSPVTNFIADGEKFRQVYSEADGFKNYIKNLQAIFLTEAYTGAYSFDICFLAAQVAEFKQSVNAISEHSAVAFDVIDPTARIGLDNSRDNLKIIPEHSQSYLTKAQPMIEKYLVCSKNQKVKAEFAVDSSGTPTGAAKGEIFKKVVAAQLEDLKIDDFGQLDAVYNCKMRYIVRETNWKSVLPIKRDTKPQGAEVCTETKFIDPPAGVKIDMN